MYRIKNVFIISCKLDIRYVPLYVVFAFELKLNALHSNKD